MAQTVDPTCGATDAPAPYASEPCGGHCTVNATTDTLTCTIANCLDDSTLIVVQDYANLGNNDFVGYGYYGGTSEEEFCCAIHDAGGTTEILKVEAYGSDYEDVIMFYEPYTGDNLEPHRMADLEGHIFGGDDVDWITGSDYSANDYTQFLNGEDGDDIIAGGVGNDVILGGPGSDLIFGGSGNDQMNGGDGDDSLLGGAGNDAHCDSSQDSGGGCSSDLFDDNSTGNDIFWYTYVGACAVAGALDPASNARGGTNYCGDAALGAWGPLPWTNCTNNLFAQPAQCP